MSCLWCENCHENLIDYDEDTFSEELQLFICEGCSNKFLEERGNEPKDVRESSKQPVPYQG